MYMSFNFECFGWLFGALFDCDSIRFSEALNNTVLIEVNFQCNLSFLFSIFPTQNYFSSVGYIILFMRNFYSD